MIAWAVFRALAALFGPPTTATPVSRYPLAYVEHTYNKALGYM